MKFFGFFLTIFFVLSAQAQQLDREFSLKHGGLVTITNLYGKVSITAEEAEDGKILLTAQSQKSFKESEIKTDATGDKITIEVNPPDLSSRIDLTLKIPLRSRVSVETREGEVRISGNLESADVTTETGTISTDVPLDALKFNFLWTASRPRYLSDVELPKEVKEKSGGRFVLSGKLGELAEKKSDAEMKGRGDAESGTKEKDEAENLEQTSKEKTDDTTKDKKLKNKKTKPADKKIELNFTTARGIVLLNVNPTQVPSNLQERPLTQAAKAIVQSGDSLLTEAIRRASPKHFGDYLKTLPPRKREPSLSEKLKTQDGTTSQIKRVLVKVTDINNRAISGLQKKDFTVQESGKPREVLEVEPTTAPFNLVLLLDVSGSVENYVNFIRKAARNFINTVSPKDKIAIVIFNEDVKTISTFTINRSNLSESLDTFDAGGGTAFYDALAFTLVDTLRPLKGERTGIVILSDGDDNRSFLPFESLLGSIQESGALVYPLYVPSGLIAASKSNDANTSVDSLRTRFMALSSRAETEGARLAQVSGGIYYPIRRLEELQKAYDDIVIQLRTAYTITFRSDSLETNTTRASPRLKIKVSRNNAFVNLGSVVDVPPNEAKNFETKEISQTEDYLKEGGEPEISFQQVQEDTGEVSELKYKPLLTNSLQIVSSENFDINKSPPAFILSDGKNQIAVSRWVSPKRTRSYPYERIYNTLLQQKRATIIPILKDEGADGERDFLQFDTVSLLNLLDVYLILGYYSDAQRDSSTTLTDQKFDNAFITNKVKELQSFKGSATEWNLQQLEKISDTLEKAKTAYAEIAKKTDVALHGDYGLDVFAKKISKSLEEFRVFSRQKSKNAQTREFQTIQPKEALSSDTKACVTITDKFGGVYFFTCDETLFENKTIHLIEAKHSIRAKMPSPSDIKDGLLKMMLYANLQNVRLGNENVSSRAVLRLTSNKLFGAISSDADGKAIENFLFVNRFNANQKGFIGKLFEEARENNFIIKIEQAEIAK